MKRIIKKNNFNPLFYKLWKEVHAYNGKRLILNMGGYGSGKSVTVSQLIILKALREPKFKALICMKLSTSINKSVLAEFIRQLNHMQVEYTLNKSERTISFPNGSVLLFTGLDSPEKLKSIPDINLGYFEEASHGDIDDVYGIDGRIRGNYNMPHKLILNFNPVSINNYLYQNFYGDNYDESKYTYFKTTYKDNRFCDPSYIKYLESFKEINFNEYRVRALAEFGIVETGNALLPNFKTEKHVKKCVYDPSLPIMISVDENVNPYLSMICGQVHDKGDTKVLKIIKEYTMKDPFNNIADLVSKFKEDFSTHKESVHIFGDATSRKKNVLDDTFYDLLLKYMKPFKTIFAVSKSNPSVSLRSLWLDTNFHTNDDFTLMIDPDCQLLILDLQVVKKDVNGGMLKEKKTINNIRLEPYGHLTDCLAYLTAGGVFANEYNIFKNGGEVKIDTSFISNVNQWQY